MTDEKTPPAFKNTLTREAFYKRLDQETHSYPHEMTDEQKRRVSIHLSKLSTGSSAMVPLYCGGETCPFKDRCPLFEMSKHPEGHQCPIENNLLKEAIYRYMEEFDIDPNVWTEVQYAGELASIDIYLTRINMILSRPENADFTTEVLAGYSVKGDKIIQSQLLPLLAQKDRLEGRRSKIIKLMVGDRQEKYKKQGLLKEIADDDVTIKMSEARRSVDQLVARVTKLLKASDEPILSPEDIMHED